MIFIAYLPTTVCVVAAAWLASRGFGYWGWFLAVACLLMVSVKGWGKSDG